MKLPRYLYFFVFLLVLIGGWYYLTVIHGVKAFFLPSPQSTFIALLKLLGDKGFWLDLWSSWYRVIAGFVISFVIAYPVVLISLFNRGLKESIFYFVEFFRYLPVPIFIPITILWFGIDDAGKIVIVVLGTFAQMIPMFYDSAVSVDVKYVSFNYALKWKKRKYIGNVVIMGSAPAVLDNSRICLGWAWTYLIVAEFVGAENGIGYAMIRAQRYLATDKIFAYIIIIGTIGILTDRFLVWARIKLFPWNR